MGNMTTSFFTLLVLISLLYSPTTSFSPRLTSASSNRYQTKRGVASINKEIVLKMNDDDDSRAIESDDILSLEEGSHGAVEITLSPENKHVTTSTNLSSSSSEKEDEDEELRLFEKKLENTLDLCENILRKKSVWIRVHMSKAYFIPLLEKYDFEFHHAQGKYANLLLWLPKDIECKVPIYATHHVGVGAVIINRKDEILCVREKRKNFMPWKIPGGLSDLGEDLADACEREVFEETNLRTKFHSILGFRHSHNMQFNDRSDLYFVCRLFVDDSFGDCDVQDLIPQESEISDVRWVPLHLYRKMLEGKYEYASSTDGKDDCGGLGFIPCDEVKNKGHPMMQKMMNLVDTNIDIQPTKVTSVVPGRKASFIFHPMVDDSTNNSK